MWEKPAAPLALAAGNSWALSATAPSPDPAELGALVPSGVSNYHGASANAHAASLSVAEEISAWHEAAVWGDAGDAAPASDWFEAWDDDAQTLYYRNEATGDTSWERPADFVGAGEADATEHAWIELWDEDTEAPYWMHSETGESTWEMPEAVANAAAASAGALEDYGAPQFVSLEDGFAGGVGAAADAGVEGEWRAEGEWGAGAEDGTIALATQWTEGWDEGSEAPYWYNETTGETVWEQPAEQAYGGEAYGGEAYEGETYGGEGYGEGYGEAAPETLCASCGEELTPLANFCRLCGTPCISLQDGFWEPGAEEGYLQNAATGEEAAWS